MDAAAQVCQPVLPGRTAGARGGAGGGRAGGHWLVEGARSWPRAGRDASGQPPAGPAVQRCPRRHCHQSVYPQAAKFVPLPVEPSVYGSGYGTVMDSGTTFNYLPSDAFGALRALITAILFDRGHEHKLLVGFFLCPVSRPSGPGRACRRLRLVLQGAAGTARTRTPPCSAARRWLSPAQTPGHGRRRLDGSTRSRPNSHRAAERWERPGRHLLGPPRPRPLLRRRVGGGLKGVPHAPPALRRRHESAAAAAALRVCCRRRRQRRRKAVLPRRLRQRWVFCRDYSRLR